MVQLIPILEKFSLMYDSCSAGAEIRDSLINNLQSQISVYKLSGANKDAVIRKLNLIIEEHGIVLKRKDDQIKLIKKKSWRKGFKFGLVTGSGVMLLIFIILL